MNDEEKLEKIAKIDRLLSWFETKLDLELYGRESIPHEGYLYWAGVGENLGAEIYGKDEYAVLAQARVMSIKRLYRRIGRIDDADFARIRKGFVNLYK